MQSIKKWLHGIVMFAILSVVSMAASATLITSFEGGSTLADNGMTITQGFTSRAVIQSSVTSGLTTLTSTESNHLLAMTAGDIQNPAFPNQLITLVDFNNPVLIDKSVFLVDFAFINGDSIPYNDRQYIGINGVLYDLTGSVETGYLTPQTLGWGTLAINFASLGSINLTLGCSNNFDDGGSSDCLWDNFRTADFAPTSQQNGGRLVISPFGPITLSGTTPPPATAVPEPGSVALLIAGLLGLGATRKRGQVPSKEG